MGLNKHHEHGTKELTRTFLQNGFGRSEAEPTLYVKQHDNGDFCIVCIYVDEMIYLESSKILVAEFKLCMQK